MSIPDIDGMMGQSQQAERQRNTSAALPPAHMSLTGLPIDFSGVGGMLPRPAPLPCPMVGAAPADNRTIARKALETASRAVLHERQDQHGSAEDSFRMIADLWAVYLRHKEIRAPGAPLNGFDVAQMMCLLKKGRAMYGNPKQIDHYADDIGYASLAAMLAGAE